MIVVDIGNTDIVVGFYINSKIKETTRFPSKLNYSSKKLKKIITNKLLKFSNHRFTHCIISSVVPNLNNDVVKIFKFFKLKVINISYLINILDIKFNIDNIKELGSDRIANSVAAIKKFGKNCVVVDFGTATTFDVIKNNVYQGGVIAPGINISHNSLVQSASKLKKISITKINKITGKNTITAMQSGFYWGYVSLINGIISKIIKEQSYAPQIILTGGLSELFNSRINYKSTVEPNLTLEGLYYIGLQHVSN